MHSRSRITIHPKDQIRGLVNAGDLLAAAETAYGFGKPRIACYLAQRRGDWNQAAEYAQRAGLPNLAATCRRKGEEGAMYRGYVSATDKYYRWLDGQDPDDIRQRALGHRDAQTLERLYRLMINAYVEQGMLDDAKSYSDELDHLIRFLA